MKISHQEVPESDLADRQVVTAERAVWFGRCKQLTIYPANVHQLFGHTIRSSQDRPEECRDRLRLL